MGIEVDMHILEFVPIRRTPQAFLQRELVGAFSELVAFNDG